MNSDWSRRHVLITGMSGLLAGCATRNRGGSSSVAAHQSSAGYQSTTVPAYTPPPQARPPAVSGLRYKVQRGDTLHSISRRSGLSVGRISNANRLTSNLIRPGQELVLPGVQSLTTDPLAGSQQSSSAPATKTETVAPGRYRLVKRSSWTKRKVGKNHRKMGKVTRITVHHTGEHAGMRGLSDIEIVKRIERYHREGKRWSSIGYHYLIGKDGRVYEGRPASIQGAHVSSANSNNLGISCIGDFHKKRPNTKQLGALVSFLNDQRRKYGVSKRRTYGHRDLGSSICPGDALYNWLKSYKRS